MDETFIKEMNDIVSNIDSIIERTRAINNYRTISKDARETLKKDTAELTKLAEKIGELSKTLNNEQLRIIGEEIEILSENRINRDNQKYLRTTSYYDELTGKYSNTSTEREEQQANYELLEELSNQLRTMGVSPKDNGEKEAIEKLVTVLNEKENETQKFDESIKHLNEKLKQVKERDKIETEISELINQLPFEFSFAALKEIVTRNLAPISIEKNQLETLPNLSDEIKHNSQRFEQINQELQRQENLLKIPNLTSIQSSSIKANIEQLKEQRNQCIENGKKYNQIIRDLNKLEEISKALSPTDTIDSIKEEISAQEEIKQKTEKEAKFEEEFSIIEKQIVESMQGLPLELRVNLGIKLEENGLLTPAIDEQLAKENDLNLTGESKEIANIADYETKLEEIQNKMLSNSQELIDYQAIYNNLIIKENTQSLTPEEVDYKQRVKKYIDDLPNRNAALQREKIDFQRVQRRYEKTDQLIDELIELNRGEKNVETITNSENSTTFDNSNNTSVEAEEILPNSMSNSTIPTNTETTENTENTGFVLVTPEEHEQIIQKKVDDEFSKAISIGDTPSENGIENTADGVMNMILNASVPENTDKPLSSESKPTENEPNTDSKTSSSNSLPGLPTSNPILGEHDFIDESGNIIRNFGTNEVAVVNNQVPRKSPEPNTGNNTNNNTENNTKTSKKKSRITNVRKSKKNIKRIIIREIMLLATAIVTLKAGNYKIQKNNEYRAKVAASYVNNSLDDNAPSEENLDDYNEIESEFGNIKLSESNEEEPELQQPKEKDLVDMIPINKSDNKTSQEINDNSQDDLSQYESYDANYLDRLYDLIQNPLESMEQNQNAYYAQPIANNEKESISNSTPTIGESITINENAPIYRNVFNAYLGNNPYNTYFNNEDERKVIGVGIWNDKTGMERVYSYNDNFQEKINEQLANGGEIVAVLTTHKINEKLPQSKEEVEKMAEGWYSVDNINLTNSNELHNTRGGR